jgi:hypothetical protein
MASMATGTGHFACLGMNALFKLFAWNGRTQGMGFDKFDIGMTTVTSLFNVGDMGH